MAPRKAKNTTRQGARFELQIMHHLAEYGYDVMRSSGSRGKIDVVAVGDIHTLWIQAKITNPRLSPAERTGVRDHAGRAEHGVSGTSLPIVAYRLSGKVHLRLLTGSAAGDWEDFRPYLHGHALCSCGHGHSEHARDTGCWADTATCPCPAFVLPSQAPKEAVS